MGSDVTEGPRCPRKRLPPARSPAAVKPLRGSSTPFRPLRVTAAADRAGSPCGPAGRLALRSRGTIAVLGEPLRCREAPLEQTERRRRRLRKGLHFRRRPHTSVHDDRNWCSTSRNRRSTSPETGVQLPPKSVFNFLRKTQFAVLGLIRVLAGATLTVEDDRQQVRRGSLLHNRVLGRGDGGAVRRGTPDHQHEEGRCTGTNALRSQVLKRTSLQTFLSMAGRRRSPTRPFAGVGHQAPIRRCRRPSGSPHVIDHFKPGGRGWQTRIDGALCDWITKQDIA